MALPGTDLPTSILFCRLCQSLFRQPRTLPCLHSFCLDCLQQLAPTTTTTTTRASPQEGNGGGGPALALSCPLCGQQAPLPPGGVAGLTANPFLTRMCQEYVGEVQKTLVSGRSLSPGAAGREGGGGGGGGGSPVSVLAGRAPAGGGGLQYSAPSLLYHQPQPQQHLPSSPTARGSPGGGGGAGVQAYSRERALSPPHSPLSDTSSSPLRSHRRSSLGVGYGAQRTASPSFSVSSTPGYMSPGGLSSSSSPQHHPHFHHWSSSSSEAVSQTARRLSSETLPSRGVGVQRRLSSTPPQVVRTWECLHRKLNRLQSASLQVTYSLETVHMAEANWHQRKQDLRRDVQRRSAQLQFFIKRQERLLLAALDARNTDDSFNTAAERARGELRTNLKSLMHETDVLRSVLDLATDEEIMFLSNLLLSSKVSQTPVTMETPELRLVVPGEATLEDMVGRDFGCLTSTLLSHSIFTPEDIVQELPEDPEEDDAFSADTPTVNMSSTTSSIISDNFDNGFEHVAYIDDDDGDEEEEDDEVVVEETLELIDGKMTVVSKRSVPSSKKQGRSQQDSKDQSTRGRATDIRRTANSSSLHTSKEDLSQSTKKLDKTAQEQPRKKEDQADEETHPANGSGSQNSMEKFQNLRESLKQKRRELLLNTSVFPPEGPPGMAHLLRGEKRVQSLDRTASMRDEPRRSLSSLTARQHPHEPRIAAPVIHTPPHTTERKDFVKHSPTKPTVTAAAAASGDFSTPVTAPLMSTSLISPPSSGDKTSRPVRRAISAASDRASKMEYLRETWRKRKELLIQNEAYIPPDKPEEGKTVPPSTSPKDNGGGPDQEGEGVTSPTGPKSKIKHSIRSRISHLKQALKKNGKAEDSSQQSKTGDKSSSGSNSSESIILGPTLAPDKPLTPAQMAAQAAAEKNVLKTIESILLKNAPATEASADSSPKTLPHSQHGHSDPSPPSGAKPSMLVKPCPRDPPATAVSPSSTTSSTTLTTTTAATLPLETLEEDEGKAADPATRRAGLRVTSPVRGEGNKEALQQIRANIRQKKERWRSMSLT